MIFLVALGQNPALFPEQGLVAMLPPDAWILVLFYFGDVQYRQERCAYRAVSRSLQNYGEHIRKIVFSACTMGGWASTPAPLLRVSFWAPWRGARKIVGPADRESWEGLRFAALRVRDYGVQGMDGDRLFITCRCIVSQTDANPLDAVFVRGQYVSHYELYCRQRRW